MIYGLLNFIVLVVYGVFFICYDCMFCYVYCCLLYCFLDCFDCCFTVWYFVCLLCSVLNCWLFVLIMIVVFAGLLFGFEFVDVSLVMRICLLFEFCCDLISVFNCWCFYVCVIWWFISWGWYRFNCFCLVFTLLWLACVNVDFNVWVVLVFVFVYVSVMLFSWYWRQVGDLFDWCVLLISFR